MLCLMSEWGLTTWKSWSSKRCRESSSPRQSVRLFSTAKDEGELPTNETLPQKSCSVFVIYNLSWTKIDMYTFSFLKVKMMPAVVCTFKNDLWFRRSNQKLDFL